ncbi:hypothetical protein [uncultured Brevundimonas sp.]|uniref:hypothetical protein n=1 Tax=uncultured Brevundimonas sp. TaxID=213418 RepID=UPI0025FC5E16|nr:hypothetical protein [uncultured Brevundimonas sp.]
MFPETIFEASLDRLADDLRGREVPAPAPLNTDSWLARSVLQKAIRRGMVDLALSAAAQLLIIDRRTLWRRLLVTALEDLGPQELETTTAIVSAYRNSSWRSQIGGDWPVVAELVRKACAGTRCQAANDLWNIAIYDPGLTDQKANLCELSPRELRDVSISGSDIGSRGAAALVAMGHADWCDARSADHAAYFSAYAEVAPAQSVILAEAFRLTRVPLAGLMLPLVTDTVQSVACADDELAPVFWNGPVPTFAMDQYTRSGKATIRAFSKASIPWAAFCDRWDVRPSDRISSAGELLFRLDGAAVTDRAITNLSFMLRARSEVLGCFLPIEAVHEGMALLRRQLPHIEKERLAYKFP